MRQEKSMVDYEKQKKFAALGEALKKRLDEQYDQEFNFFQGYNANRFEIHIKRPADPYYDLTFTTDERLAISVGDGIYVSPFTAVVNLSHCAIDNEDPDDYGWHFDEEAIWSALQRLMDLGTAMYKESKKAELAKRTEGSG